MFRRKEVRIATSRRKELKVSKFDVIDAIWSFFVEYVRGSSADK